MGYYQELSRMTFKADCLDFFAFVYGKEKIDDTKIKEGTELYNLYSNYEKVTLYTSNRSSRSCSHVLQDDFKNKPKLLTVARTINNHHPPSALGNHILESIDYNKARVTPQKFIDEHNGKYVARLIRVFDIKKNNIKTWNEFCTNGLFNIWNPAAPYNRLNISNNRDPYYYQTDSFEYNVHTKKYDVESEGDIPIHYQLKGGKILLLRIYKLRDEDIFKADEIRSTSDFHDSIQPRNVLIDEPVIDDKTFNCIYSKIKDTLDGLKKSIPYFSYMEDPDVRNYPLEYIPFEERKLLE